MDISCIDVEGGERGHPHQHDTARAHERVGAGGQHQRVLPNDALLSPNFELGIRYDDGDAETGFGMELGGGLQYAELTPNWATAWTCRGPMPS